MTTLVRWDPIREMMQLQNMVDRLFEAELASTLPLWRQTAGAWALPLDVIETEDEFIVKASIPGIDPNELDISLADNVLTIKGEIKAEEEAEDVRYHLRERRFGMFQRSISLPVPVDADKVEAVYEHGVLTLHIPKAEEVKPKHISIKKVS
ncbi:MAG TPA: Hsp20/alpha crystallin family protein [Anaerolineae bacterium]|nr:Hsp20/alpha crystallin family protein [Anaerolineae bacterium]